MTILVTGFPYVRDRYFAVFRHWPAGDEVRFLLPRRWTAKGGKVVFMPPDDARVVTTRAYFHDSHTPIIGGLLKGWMPAFPLHLWRMRHKVDVVYACSEPTLLSTLWFAVWSRLMGKKFACFTWENIRYHDKFRGLSRIVHDAILRANLLLSHGLVCGNPEGVAIHQRYRVLSCAVIPMNGVDAKLFKRSEPRASSLSAHTVYAFVGALGFRKGIHLVLEALPEVLKVVANAHVVIAGSGEYEREIDRKIKELGLQEHVTRFPWLSQDEIVRLLSAAHVFVYPSIPHRGWAEQFGYSMAEASLMELPVISTDSGSIRQVVRDGETGILVPPGNLEALTAAMVRLGTDEPLRHRLGAAGRQWVLGEFSHERVASQLAAFFENLKKPHA